MASLIEEINAQFKKSSVTNVRSGDNVRVHQKIREGNKERIQVFQGLVIKTSKIGGHLSRITVRRVASGVGVEKSFLLNSPLIVKVEVTKRSKVRRNYLSYMRERTGKSARLASIGFDKEAVNASEEQTKPEVKEAPSETKDEVIEEPAAKETKPDDEPEESKDSN
jgi:large subunit ribosomal protein L19